jgi:hypothetical protein
VLPQGSRHLHLLRGGMVWKQSGRSDGLRCPRCGVDFSPHGRRGVSIIFSLVVWLIDSPLNEYCDECAALLGLLAIIICVPVIVALFVMLAILV